MAKKKTPSVEDIDLFQKAIEGTKPLVNEKIRLNTRVPTLIKKTSKIREDRFTFSEADELSAVGGDESMIYKQEGLSNKLLRKLRKGQYNVDAILDLHGNSINEAMVAVNECLQQCVHDGLQVVLMIHGKGHHSQMPILKNKLNHWLRHMDVVLAFCSATPAHGGHGAIYVLLKRSTEENHVG
jgi:DNA-nicking Smr family endonuclease